MKSLSEKIDAIIEQKSLLKHPFYQMWSDGKLSQESLAGYSKEYFQMVKAVPSFVENIAEFAAGQLATEIRKNQQEEAEHIQPWIGFAAGLGVDSAEISNYEGLAKTK
ncbi:MAG: pyrroloquinoline quinone biosynthesis protein PqqC, partial [Candidatus Nitrosotenuis sp.]